MKSAAVESCNSNLRPPPFRKKVPRAMYCVLNSTTVPFLKPNYSSMLKPYMPKPILQQAPQQTIEEDLINHRVRISNTIYMQLFYSMPLGQSRTRPDMWWLVFYCVNRIIPGLRGDECLTPNRCGFQLPTTPPLTKNSFSRNSTTTYFSIHSFNLLKFGGTHFCPQEVLVNSWLIVLA